MGPEVSSSDSPYLVTYRKKQFDKRAAKKNRDWNRDKARYIRKSS